MIKTTNLDKYFNEGKSNKIHVINNTSLEFPQTGLVSLVGQSGSGKTTLLNVISGLDKAKGTIEFDDIIMKKYDSSKWDKIRAHDIGYVFQNYYLLEDRSLFDNVALTLNMIGIVDKEEVEYRTNYVLNAVGLFRFRKKKASDLSGGQKQRVAIARAIAKNPKVIIADEPTGNLDSVNSIEIMKMIKKISEERLVVLVTHNMNLANKYSDRIIQLSDGVVTSDEENTLSEETELIFDDNNIYLGNLNNHSDNTNVQLYSNNEDNDIKVTLIKINNNYFLKPENENIRINIIDSKSGIKVIDSKKEEHQKNNSFETDFSLDQLDKIKTERVKKRTLSYKEAFISAFKKMSTLGRKSKLQIVALILLGAMFATGVHTLISNVILDTSSIYDNENVYRKQNNELPDIDHNKAIYFNYYGNDGIVIKNNYSNSFYINTTSLPISVVDESELSSGRYPKNDYEILIDETILDSKSEFAVYFYGAGITKRSHLVNQKIVYGDLELTIVGTVKSGSKGVYINENIINLYRQKDILTYNDNIVLSEESKIPVYNKAENGIQEVVVLNDGYIEIGKIINMMGTEFTVVGLFDLSSSKGLYTYYVAQEVADILSKNPSVYSVNNLNIYTTDSKYIKDNNLINIKEFKINNLREERSEKMIGAVIQMSITIALSALIFFFLVRSSLTTRVKEISILRSLGVSKFEVLSLFTVEYFILTACTSLIGALIGTYIVNVSYNSVLSDLLATRVTPISFILVIVGIFVTNILLALIPVSLRLRQTPSQMLTEYDI